MRHLVIIATVVLGTSSAQAGGPQLSGTKWYQDLKQAHKAAKASGQPILVVFGSERCLYCRKLERYTLSQPAMSRFLGTSFVPVYLDFNKNRRAAEILKVKSLPSTVVLTTDADVLGRAVGYVKPDKFRTLLTTALEQRAKVRPSSAP